MPVSTVARQSSSKPNPFDSDSDSEFTSRPAKASSSYSIDPGSKSIYKNGFHDSGGFENQSVQELESYAAHKAEETTRKVNDCLRLAENIKEDVTNTLITLHRQGEQINRTHETAANIDQDLSRSETLLGSLGGFFSKSWKPKKTRQIKGPTVITRDDSFKRRVNHLEQREKLGLSSSPTGNLNPQNILILPTPWRRFRWRKKSKTMPFLILAMYWGSSSAWLWIWARKLIAVEKQLYLLGCEKTDVGSSC